MLKQYVNRFRGYGVTGGGSSTCVIELVQHALAEIRWDTY